MSYCTASDVASLNKARVLGAGNNPTASDVTGYINMIAGEINSILVNKGYGVPINTASHPEAGALLLSINAKGAIALSEEASPNSPNVDRARAAYDAAMKMLADASFVLDVPMDQTRSEPRGPFVTYQPSGRVYDPMFAGSIRSADVDSANNPADPFLSRQMEF